MFRSTPTRGTNVARPGDKPRSGWDAIDRRAEAEARALRDLHALAVQQRRPRKGTKRR